MSRYQFSRSSDQDSSPRKKTRTIYSDSSDEELEYLSRRSVSQKRRKRFNPESRSDILTQIQRQILSPDELAHRRIENTKNVLNRIEEEEEEPDSHEYPGGGRKVVSSRRRSNSIQSSPYHQPSHSQEYEDVFRRPLSRERREVSLSQWRSPSLRELQNDGRLRSQEYRERRGVSLSRWPDHSSLRELPNDERLRSQEFRSEGERKVQSLSRVPSCTSLRDIRYEDKSFRAHAIQECRAENEQRVQSLSRWPSRTSVRDIQYEDRPSRVHAIREHRAENEQRLQSLSRWPSRTSVRDIQYEDRPSRVHAIREHSLRMDEELRPRRREYYSDFDHREDISYSKRKELLQRNQPLRGSSRDRIQQLPSSHQERVQSVEDSHPSSSVLRDSVPNSRSLPRSQEEKTRKRVPLTVWSSDSDSSEPVIVKERLLVAWMNSSPELNSTLQIQDGKKKTYGCLLHILLPDPKILGFVASPAQYSFCRQFSLLSF
ncbi:trichohyalin [Anabrus simplex]|uniref:trichohyalin n=1 Tax=Anabrus simplex TaxID=316456 RepID=UPI0035A32676